MKRYLTPLRMIALTSALAVVTFSACTKKSAETQAPEAQSTTAATAPSTQASPEAQATQAAAPTGKIDTELSIGTKGDNMYYNKDEMTVKSGQTVKLTFHNNASPSSNMNHNWVLVKPGTQQQVANAGMTAGDAKGWVAEGPDVIAHTALTAPGKTSSVVFKAPAPGDYPYLCTFPGHNVTMHGVLHVK